MIAHNFLVLLFFINLGVVVVVYLVIVHPHSMHSVSLAPVSFIRHADVAVFYYF